MATDLNDIEHIVTNHVDAASTPWIPFVPVNENIDLKYFKIDPARGEIMALLRVPPGQGIHKHHHTGTVIVYTEQGSWKYEEHDWEAKPGDFVFETASSAHTFTPTSDEPVVAFVVVQGELNFLDDSGNIAYTDNWQTALARYRQYCAENGITEIPLTSFEG